MFNHIISCTEIRGTDITVYVLCYLSYALIEVLQLKCKKLLRINYYSYTLLIATQFSLHTVLFSNNFQKSLQSILIINYKRVAAGSIETYFYVRYNIIASSEQAVMTVTSLINQLAIFTCSVAVLVLFINSVTQTTPERVEAPLDGII